MKIIDEKELLTAVDAAKFAGISYPHATRLRLKGKFPEPTYQFMKRMYYEKSKLREWMKTRKS